MPFEAGIVGLALREHITENDIGQVAVIAESNGVQIPIGGIVEIDMPITDIRLYRHTARRAADLGLAPQLCSQLLKLLAQKLRARVGDVLAGAVILARRDAPLKFKRDLPGNLGRDERRNVEGFDLLALVIGLVQIGPVPCFEGNLHLLRQRGVDVLHLLNILIRNHSA